MRPIKFLLYGDKILIGRVNLHKYLLPHQLEEGKPIRGGGIANVDHKNKIVVLSGQSYDFGPFDRNIVEELEFDDKRLAGYTKKIMDY
jgi:hypothetical protein